MARKPRLEFEGAIYHVINRGNYRKDLFSDKRTAGAFEKALFEVCEKCRWTVHGHVVMRNHFHLAVETLEANLKSQMGSGLYFKYCKKSQMGSGLYFKYCKT